LTDQTSDLVPCLSTEAIPEDLVLSMIKQAKESGASDEFVRNARNELLGPLEDVWRLTLGNDPPANVRPFTIKLTGTVVIPRTRNRTFNPKEL
jgi:hypothetical protein